jgi:hypothetical protein
MPLLLDPFRKATSPALEPLTRSGPSRVGCSVPQEAGGAGRPAPPEGSGSVGGQAEAPVDRALGEPRGAVAGGGPSAAVQRLLGDPARPSTDAVVLPCVGRPSTARRTRPGNTLRDYFAPLIPRPVRQPPVATPQLPPSTPSPAPQDLPKDPPRGLPKDPTKVPTKDPTKVPTEVPTKDPPAPPRVGIAWGDVVSREPGPRGRPEGYTAVGFVDPVWLTFEGVIPDDAAKLELLGVDGTWRGLPAKLSRAEPGAAGGGHRFTLQISVAEAESLGLSLTHQPRFRMRDAHGVASVPTEPTRINDPANPLAIPDFRPMEDRFAGDDHIRQPGFVPAEVPITSSIPVLQSAVVTVDRAGIHLSLPPGSLPPGAVVDVDRPFHRSGRGIVGVRDDERSGRGSLGLGSHAHQVGRDGRLDMTIAVDGPRSVDELRPYRLPYALAPGSAGGGPTAPGIPAESPALVLRIRGSAGGVPEPVALVSRGLLVPWTGDPLAFMRDERGEWDYSKYRSHVHMEGAVVSPDRSTLAFPAGTAPEASYAAVHNATARGLQWPEARVMNRVPVAPDGSFTVNTIDPRFGQLRVNDEIVVVIGPDVQSIHDGVCAIFRFDGERLVVSEPPSSLAFAVKHGTSIKPKDPPGWGTR